MKIAEENEAVFIKRPVVEKKMLIMKNYVKSDILHDTTEKFYGIFKKNTLAIKKLPDFPLELELGSEQKTRPTREEVEPTMGYCIRTGVKIPFNLHRPYCDAAYKSWVQFRNCKYPEKFCHKTGKESNGRTSMQNPILNG